jgi:cytochrome c peroxidase
MLARFSVAVLLLSAAPANAATAPPTIDERLRQLLDDAGFTGTIEESLTTDRFLGRDIDKQLFDIGRRLWFDKILSLHEDTTCASCHSPTNGWGDTQSIAIGVQSNDEVGPGRTGPRNRRSSPMTANAAFYPALMWDGRFFAPGDDPNPFDNTDGFTFPAPEGEGFLAGDANVTHLLGAQAFIPVTELAEMAGFNGTTSSPDDPFAIFEDSVGDTVPDPDVDGYRNDPIRDAILEKLNANYTYRHLFRAVFGTSVIDFTMVGAALAEFQFRQIAADAPLDQYVRNDDDTALTLPEKRGALLFFDPAKANCVSCHQVSGTSNEMFSDFQTHVIAAPQISPVFGVGTGNVIFDGANEDQDYGLEETTGLFGDRYKFRTAPLRNLARAPAYFHDGAFTDLGDAIQHHLSVLYSTSHYDPEDAGLDPAVYQEGPVHSMLDDVDALVATPLILTDQEFYNLVAFVRDALLDDKAMPGQECAFMPTQDEIPSGFTLETFPACPEGHR